MSVFRSKCVWHFDNFNSLYSKLCKFYPPKWGIVQNQLFGKDNYPRQKLKNTDFSTFSPLCNFWVFFDRVIDIIIRWGINMLRREREVNDIMEAFMLSNDTYSFPLVQTWIWLISHQRCQTSDHVQLTILLLPCRFFLWGMVISKRLAFINRPGVLGAA